MFRKFVLLNHTGLWELGVNHSKYRCMFIQLDPKGLFRARYNISSQRFRIHSLNLNLPPTGNDILNFSSSSVRRSLPFIPSGPAHARIMPWAACFSSSTLGGSVTCFLQPSGRPTGIGSGRSASARASLSLWHVHVLVRVFHLGVGAGTQSCTSSGRLLIRNFSRSCWGVW